MHDQPSVSELVQAVKNFVDHTAATNLSGHAAFHARVASNVLATILRDLEARPDNDTAELARLQALLDREGDLEMLNRALCTDIKSGKITTETDGLLAHLKATAVAQVKVDQPKYSGLKTATD